MGKLIDSDALKSVFRRHYPINYKILSTIIDDMPEETTAWIEETDRKNHWHCQRCGYTAGIAVWTYRHCPNCGRRVQK